MRLRLLASIVFAGIVAATPALAQRPPVPPVPPAPPAPPPHGRYQGGPEQTDRVSRKVKLGRQGSVIVSNIAGAIVVNAGSGDEVSIEAVKRARGNRAQLDQVQVTVDDRPGRVEIGINHMGRTDQVEVDFTITVPSDASVDAHSVSGDIKVTGAQGLVRTETVSGTVVDVKTPRLERAKSVSGDVELTDVASDTDVTIGSVSGNVRARGLKAGGLDLTTVSGDLTLSNVTSERVSIRSVSGSVEYDGPLARSGRYEINSHSGDIRLTVPPNAGFDLNASSFSGSIRSDLPLTIGGTASNRGDRREGRGRGMGQSMRATYGDGSAMLTIRTFSGDVVIAKK